MFKSTDRRINLHAEFRSLYSFIHSNCEAAFFSKETQAWIIIVIIIEYFIL